MYITRELRELRDNLGLIINKHEKLRHSYFWRPAGHASGRRANEVKNNINYESKRYRIYCECNYQESCKNVYYKGIFSVEGKRVTIAYIKKLYIALNEIV